GDGDRLEMYHDRIREAVARRLEPAVQNRLHLRLAEALDASGQADPEVLAEHFRAARELARAGRYALAGATQAARTLAFDRAAELYQLALELLPASGEERAPLYAQLGDAHANAGRGAEAADAYRKAAALGDAGFALEMRRRAAEQLLRTGHIDDGIDLLRSV